MLKESHIRPTQFSCGPSILVELEFGVLFYHGVLNVNFGSLAIN